ncbi:hypothetical protein [Sphingomonas oligophenolica]|uniref:Nuclear transport factor 2 family protein n=1 Tax=Sphingomonas oligophenolica TaxID=301154 RepID=A0A502CHE6_9SPHN|nr:hypothetical protein [Sphingomonas oligophenolica]TPG12398.1 hypothetical protein EAH84_09590 [Sphingomonas oligophenolica]
MRRSILFALLATAACSRSHSGSDQGANAATVASSNVRGPEASTSASAREARSVVVRYFDLIEHHDYAGARKLWGHGGADSGGDAKAFAAIFAPYAMYEPTVGEPTDVHVADGMQYVNIGTTVHAKQAKTGKILDQQGPVMLRRSIDPDSADTGDRDWTIWGVDIRTAH